MALTSTSTIRNKIKREEIYHKLKANANKLKLHKRIAQRKIEAADPAEKVKRLLENIPRTLENTREADVTIVSNDEEVRIETETDEFSHSNKPKVLITTSKRASASVYKFANEFTSIFPDATFVNRGSQFDIKRLVEIGNERAYTCLIIINEDKKEANAITMINLPNGPTAYYKLSSIKLNADISGHATLGPHNPELILNNFSTRLGHTIGRFFSSLFPQIESFEGRQACTFHNQRDFLFFRRHRYIFVNNVKANIQEIGPRFTLKLEWLQSGTFDRKYGSYEYLHTAELDTSRTKFHI